MKTVFVSAAIIHDGRNIYLARKAKGEYKGFWEFPGGKIEQDESGEMAVVREIREELGLDIFVEQKLFTVEHDSPTFHLKMDCFLCSICSGGIKLSEHDDARWFSIAQLDDLPLLPADEKVREELKLVFSS